MRLFQIRNLVDFNLTRASPMYSVIVGYNITIITIILLIDFASRAAHSNKHF